MSGTQNVSTPKMAKGKHSQRNHGRFLPQRLLVLSNTMPQIGASMASISRAINRMVPAAAAERPATSV